MLQLAKSKRDNAVRARRLAKMLSALSDHDNLLEYAAELERDAQELELEAQSRS
ncbi:hypothetical protein [Reyranella sp.]|uniref:hypothetical protein n=1 Tax=Reyranella sp. TaxID=1929291 RepID=UPI003D098C56